ncbi:glycosyltransferase family 4 protein [bacterium]|nr:glycosyltransferase family 4 protein [bacterium]
MKIAIDISLLGAIYTGQHFYITSLLKTMIARHPEDRFILLTYGARGRSDFAHFKNVEFLKLLSGKYSRAKRILHQQMRLNHLVRKITPEVYFSPAFVQPVTMKGVKKIVTIHDLIYKEFPRTYSKVKNIYLDKVLKRALTNSDKIIAISKHTKSDILKYFNIPEDKIAVVYYGVDEIFKEKLSLDAVRENTSALDLPDNFYFYIGTLEPRKNIPYMVKNFDLFLNKYPENHLILWGWKGNLPNEVFKVLSEVEHKNNIHFRGYIDHNLLPSVMRLARGMFFVSLYEGFGLPPVEAMSAACPLFTSKISSIPEVAGDGGIYVDINVSDGLYKKLIWAEEHADEVASIVEKGEIIASNFTWERAAEETYRLFI